MSEPISPPAGADPAVWVAGRLAETGVTQLEVLEPGQPPRVLSARGTDLPGLLRGLPQGSVLRSADRSVTVQIGEQGAMALLPFG